jgi:parallel beta-helix repeat protein
MKRKMVSAVTLTLLLISMLTLAFNIQPVKAEGTIYIRADGSVDPPTAPISSIDNVTYTFTGDIYDSIVVERSSIIIDGAGHTLSGNRSGTGVSLCGTNNVTVRKTNVIDFYYGIYIDSAFYVVLSDNNISGNWYGIWLWASTNNTICGSKITHNTLGILAVYSSDNNIYGNIVADNNDDGIVLNHSPKNTLSENDISNSADEGIRLVNSSCNILSQNNIVDCDYCGLWLENSANNSVVGNNVANNLYGIHLEFSSSNNDFDSNIMVNNTYSFGVSGASLSDYIQEIDASNTVNGEPICYWVNKQDAAIPLNSGYVALVNCTNIAVENLTLENNVGGILLAFTANSTITRNIVLDNWEGIKLHNSSNNEVAVNNLTNNFHGIRLSESSNNAISRNYIVSNNRGAFLDWSSEYNSIFGNYIVNNTYGIDIWTSSNNFIYDNNFVDNTYQARTDNVSYSVNIWDNGYSSGGNYWNDYTGIDSNSDGIGDTPYVIDANNQDRYPLMHPWSPLPVHNINTGLGYATIQEAIDASETLNGHTIFVETGTYYENVVVNKDNLAIIGENTEKTVIDGKKIGSVIFVTSMNATVSGFTIQNSSGIWPNSGILLWYSADSVLSNNIVTNNMGGGIHLEGSSWNTLSNNMVTNNDYHGIRLFSSSNNKLDDNNVANNEGHGILLRYSSSNILSNNIVMNDAYGFCLWYSSDNSIFGNTLTNNRVYGIFLGDSSRNIVFHNNFINNTNQAYISESYDNSWDDGYPSGGNYWSDYTGDDVKSGPNQDLPGSDGIGDTPYVIDADNVDRYPLMNPYGAPPPPAYSLTITATVGGTTDPAAGTYGYTANSTVQVTATPNANYLFDHWELDGVNVGSANPYSVTMDKNHTLKAVFSPIPPPLSVSISPLSASILVGQPVTFTSTVSGGYAPYSYQWYLNGAPVSGATAASWTFTPTTSGIYYVHLKVTDNKGNTAQSETARVTVTVVPVGGYSTPIKIQTKTEPVLPYIALIAALTAILTKLRPKTKRKH